VIFSGVVLDHSSCLQDNVHILTTGVRILITKGAIISGIDPDSIGEELGIEPGDRVLSINGQPIRDILDYRFMVDDNQLEIELQKVNGEYWTLEIDKNFEENLGLQFEQVIFDRIKPCINKCMFCFVDQLPAGMRNSLYLKDDDFRLSFLFGNFISLTNLTSRDWDKILGMRLSPLYISVHATDPDVRERMFGSKKARSIIEDLHRLHRHNIQIHTQIVLCPKINDGHILDQTIADLSALWPTLKSIGIVPVGMTRYREHLPVIDPVGVEQAQELINKVNEWQASFRQTLGVGLVYLADEFYVRAGLNVPAPAYYDDYPQLENGIGLITCFLNELHLALEDMDNSIAACGPFYLVCGYSAIPMFNSVIRILSEKGIELRIIPVENRSFGGGVTVTGLLTGKDIEVALGNDFIGKTVFLSEVMLQDDRMTFLDDMTVSRLAEKSGARLQVVSPGAAALLEQIRLYTAGDYKGEVKND